MNSFPEYHDPATEEQAALWAAKLDGSVMSATDRLALDEWLAHQPDHRALLSRYCQFSADLEQQMPLIAGIKELSAESKRVPTSAQPSPWLRWPLMAGAALSAAAVVAGIFWLTQPRQQFDHLATAATQRQTLTLVDGSTVELNAQSSLQIQISAQTRHLRLAAGEAFFSVHKDPSRPFTVETPSGSVRVTGTKFNVRTETTDVLEVTVLEGSVQAQPGSSATHPATPIPLRAGETLLASHGRSHRQQLSAAELDDALAWRQGQIVFNDVPLREVLARFAHYHGRGISATDEVAELKIGARFSLDDLDGFFAGLEAGWPAVEVTRNPNGTVQVGQRAGR